MLDSSRFTEGSEYGRASYPLRARPCSSVLPKPLDAAPFLGSLCTLFGAPFAGTGTNWYLLEVFLGSAPSLASCAGEAPLTTPDTGEPLGDDPSPSPSSATASNLSFCTAGGSAGLGCFHGAGAAPLE